MNLLKLKIKSVYQEHILTDKEYEDFDFFKCVPYNDMSEYITDEDYEEKYIDWELVENIKLKLWLLTTKVRDYGTYDSGVFYGFTKDDALKNAIMLCGDFVDSDIKLLAETELEEVEHSEVCTSFNAG